MPGPGRPGHGCSSEHVGPQSERNGCQRMVPPRTGRTLFVEKTSAFDFSHQRGASVCGGAQWAVQRSLLRSRPRQRCGVDRVKARVIARRVHGLVEQTFIRRQTPAATIVDESKMASAMADDGSNNCRDRGSYCGQQRTRLFVVSRGGGSDFRSGGRAEVAAQLRTLCLEQDGRAKDANKERKLPVPQLFCRLQAGPLV